ncbi:PREDICTED: neurocalcin homolog [Branchiostoma belcheri]|uniref:Neurocalcin homolog n=1 Tax=Branchiostoma belcheri TaxID=7741 RepID=A0A6P4YTM6_BRABE|nr:PREDICTED: neurocalcin homolog [Branchiostoma belcheri]XP_019632788.1 PREDICTED: neurocalcin homolog [Branchiostoma belcheri]
MGNASGKNRKKRRTRKELEELASVTEFDVVEIKQWYKSFLKDCPSGQLTVNQFVTVYSNFFSTGDEKSKEKMARQVFRNFDRDGGGTVDFREFICAMSVMSRGSTEQKLKWAFNMYDLDGNGTISKRELLEIITVVFNMKEREVKKLPEDESSPEKLTEKIFSELDTDQDGELSLKEFLEGNKRNPSIMKLMQPGP